MSGKWRFLPCRRCCPDKPPPCRYAFDDFSDPAMGPNWGCNWPIVSGAAQADGQDCEWLGANPLNGMNLWASVDARTNQRGDRARLYVNGGRQYLERFSGAPGESSRLRLFSGGQPAASTEDMGPEAFSRLTIGQTGSIVTTGRIPPSPYKSIYRNSSMSTSISKDSNRVLLGGSSGVLFDNFSLEHEKETLSYCPAAHPGCLVFWDRFTFNPLASPSPSPPDWILSDTWEHERATGYGPLWNYPKLKAIDDGLALVNIDDPGVSYYSVTFYVHAASSRYVEPIPEIRLVADYVDPGNYLYVKIEAGTPALYFMNPRFGERIGGIDHEWPAWFSGWNPIWATISIGPNQASFEATNFVATSPCWKLSHAPSSRRAGVLVKNFNPATCTIMFSAVLILKQNESCAGCPSLCDP